MRNVYEEAVVKLLKLKLYEIEDEISRLISVREVCTDLELRSGVSDRIYNLKITKEEVESLLNKIQC